MPVLQTPEDAFRDLPEFPWPAHYHHLQDPDQGALRMAYVDEGPRDAPVVLMLHGEPTWGFAWRKLLPPLLAAGLRCVVPDHIGFGRSDKLPERGDYSYAGFVAWMRSFVEALDLRDITLVCQDWGGPIGLSVLASCESRFRAVVAANTLLPNCEPPPKGIDGWPGEAIEGWVSMTAAADDLPVGEIVAGVCVNPVPEVVKAAYDAPFPDARYKAAVLEFPSLIPVSEDKPGCAENRVVWQVLENWHKPFVTAFSDSDPTTAAWAEVFQRRVPGADGAPHTTIEKAGHFVQEEQGEALAEAVLQVAT